jgi:hypothetical protein
MSAGRSGTGLPMPSLGMGSSSCRRAMVVVLALGGGCHAPRAARGATQMGPRNRRRSSLSPSDPPVRPAVSWCVAWEAEVERHREELRQRLAEPAPDRRRNTSRRKRDATWATENADRKPVSPRRAQVPNRRVSW